MTSPRKPGESGPIPARDLLRPAAPPPPGGAAAEVAPDADVLSFERAGEVWLARAAGAGSYGTGRRGAARLLAVHFFRDSEPEEPIREALISAGVFSTLQPAELLELFDRATPIDRPT